MSDLIKSITTTTVSVNDVFEEAFEVAVEATPSNNDLILSYNPVSQTIGKSTFPADATAIAVEAKTKAATALKLVEDLSTSKIQIVDNTDKTVTFTSQKYIRQFTVTSDYTPVIDFTNAQIGCGTVLNILQTNGAKVLWPVNVKPKGYPLADQDGVVNTYYVICEDINKYRFFRTVDSADFPVDDTNPTPVVVGTTTVTAGAIDQTTALINWTEADNATSYMVDRYLNNDFSDTPVTVYPSGTDFTFTDTGLTPNTNYYYKVTPSNGSSIGAFGSVTIKTDPSTVVLFDGTINDGVDEFTDAHPANYSGPNGSALFTQGNQYFYKQIPINEGDHLKITVKAFIDAFASTDNVGGTLNVNDQNFHLSQSMVNGDGNIIIDVPSAAAINPTGTPFSYVGFNGIWGGYWFTNGFKVEKYNSADVTPVVVGSTTVTSGAVDQTTAVINWTETDNATSYKVDRYLNSDFSDTPVTIYPSGTDFTFTDTGLTPNTNYYYKVTPSNGSSIGAFGSVAVKTDPTIVVLFDGSINDGVDEFTDAHPANYNGPSNAPALFTQGNQYIYKNLNINPNDHLKITVKQFIDATYNNPNFNPQNVGGSINVNDQEFHLDHTMVDGDGNIVIDVPSAAPFTNMGRSVVQLTGIWGGYWFVNGFKVEKYNSAGSSSNYTTLLDKIFDDTDGFSASHANVANVNGINNAVFQGGSDFASELTTDVSVSNGDVVKITLYSVAFNSDAGGAHAYFHGNDNGFSHLDIDSSGNVTFNNVVSNSSALYLGIGNGHPGTSYYMRRILIEKQN